MMSDQREQRSPTGVFGVVLRPLVVLTGMVVSIALVMLAWDGTGAATGLVQMRIFLVGWAIAAVVVLSGLLFAGSMSPTRQRSLRPVSTLAVQHLAVGVVVGLAIGTTDWATLRLAGWWQLWWMVPLLLIYSSHLVTLRGLSRTRS